jgi:hypothetical protein
MPDIALNPPGAPLVEVRAVALDDGARITLRSETTVDAPSRQLEMRNRYERRASGSAVEREDETLSMTWLDEDDVIALLGAAGYADVAILRSPWPRGKRSFGVSARSR